MARTIAKSKITESSPIAAPARGKPAGDPPQAGGPTHDEIAVRAYQIFLARNGAPGDALSDWMQAERELVNHRRA